MPLFDLAPSRVTLDDQGFELRWLGKTTRVSWREIESAEVRRRLCVRLKSRTIEVPRNARAYLELYFALHRIGRLRIPAQLSWSSAGWTAFALGSGIGIVALGLLVEWLFPFVFIGCAVIAMSTFCWERYTVDESGITARGVYKTKRFLNSTLVARLCTSFSYPQLFVSSGSGLIPHGGPQEVAATLLHCVFVGQRLKRPLLRARSRAPRKSTVVGREWLAWLFLGLPLLGSVLVRILDDGWPAELFVAQLLPLLLFCTRGKLFVRYDATGLYRFTVFGPRWDDSSSFVRIRVGELAVHLIRRDGSRVSLSSKAPVDWMLENWMANPERQTDDGYRTHAVTNRRARQEAPRCGPDVSSVPISSRVSTTRKP